MEAGFPVRGQFPAVSACINEELPDGKVDHPERDTRSTRVRAIQIMRFEKSDARKGARSFLILERRGDLKLGSLGTYVPVSQRLITDVADTLPASGPENCDVLKINAHYFRGEVKLFQVH